VKRERLHKIKRERLRRWKVHKCTEEPQVKQPDERTRTKATCGSSIAHGQCVYAGPIENGVTQCGARFYVWNGCCFRSTHESSPSRNALEHEELRQ
jgi:hypothetical protein